MYAPAALQSQKKEATQFLEAFQKTPEAWHIAHELLADSSRQAEMRMFAAQTLRSKATYDLGQLPIDAIEQLKVSLLNLLDVYADQDRAIRTQLCLALCQLALQYQQWVLPVEDVTTILAARLPALLEFLRILPEELTETNRTNLTDEEFDARTKLLITDNVETVISLLSDLAQNHKTYSALVLDCLTAWIKEVPVDQLLRVEPLAQLMFDALMDDETFDTAVECLGTVLKETRDIHDASLIDALYSKLMDVHRYFSQNAEKLEDPSVAAGVTRLYVDAGELWHVLVAKNALHFLPLVRVILECAQYADDLDVVKFTFYFWYLLKQMLTLPRLEDARRTLSPVYMDLTRTMIAHLKYPEGETHSGNDDTLALFSSSEAHDKFKDFRYEIGDVLKDCCAVVGAAPALDVPFQQLQTALATPNAPWQQLEAPLFAMRIMAKEVPVKEKTMLPVIMRQLVQLPEHPRVRYAATLVLGRYLGWTAQHPEFLEPQLNYIAHGLEQPTLDIASATAQALMYFCQDCAELLVPYVDQLHGLYTLVHGTISTNALYDMVNGLAHVLRQLPTESQAQALEQFLKPTLEKISNLLESGTPENRQVVDSLYEEAEVLAIFLHVVRCTDFELPFPVADFVMASVWPLAAATLTKFSSSLKVCERFCKVLKNAVQGCSVHLAPILAHMCQVLHQGFTVSQFGCFLWVSGVIIREYSDEMSPPEASATVYELGVSQSRAFFAIASDENVAIRSLPDVVEDFYHMVGDLMMYFPAAVLTNQEFASSLIKSALAALALSEEKPPLLLCVHFLVDLVLWALEFPPVSFFDGNATEIQISVQEALHQHGAAVVASVVRCLVYKLGNDVDANDLVVKCLTVAPAHSQPVDWIRAAVCSLPNVGPRELEKLMQLVQLALPSKDSRRVRIALRDFVSWYTRRNVNARLA